MQNNSTTLRFAFCKLNPCLNPRSGGEEFRAEGAKCFVFCIEKCPAPGQNFAPDSVLMVLTRLKTKTNLRLVRSMSNPLLNHPQPLFPPLPPLVPPSASRPLAPSAPCPSRPALPHPWCCRTIGEEKEGI